MDIAVQTAVLWIIDIFPGNYAEYNCSRVNANPEAAIDEDQSRDQSLPRDGSAEGFLQPDKT